MKTREQQLADAKTQAEGLKNTLVSSVKSGEIPGTTSGNRVKNPVPETYDPEASALRINNFSAALNVAIDQARQSRQDTTMDFMNGVVPAGALPATSFAGVLSAFNSDSAPLESSLITSASNFAQGQEEAKQKMAEDTAKMLEDSKNSIRELALAVGKAGGKQETIDAITTLVNSGDIDAAIKIGASALAGDGITQLGSQLVRIDPDTGNVEVIYSAPKSNGGDTPTKSEQNDATVGAAEQVLVANRGADGKTNTAVYMDFYNEWIAQKQPEANFFKLFPPDIWLNADDSSVPAHVKNRMKVPKADKKTEEDDYSPESLVK